MVAAFDYVRKNHFGCRVLLQLPLDTLVLNWTIAEYPSRWTARAYRGPCPCRVPRVQGYSMRRGHGSWRLFRRDGPRLKRSWTE